MRVLAAAMTVVTIWTIARCAEAQDKKSDCYQGDFVVDSHETREQLKTTKCILGDLIWKLSFDTEEGRTVHVDTVSAPLLRSVDAIEIHGSYVKFLDFPLLVKRVYSSKSRKEAASINAAEWIDASEETAPMLCCFEIVYLAGQSGAYFNTGCRNWGCEPRNR